MRTRAKPKDRQGKQGRGRRRRRHTYFNRLSSRPRLKNRAFKHKQLKRAAEETPVREHAGQLAAQ
eukprot:12935489-Prorocentrum_lima.AAC.1